MATARTAWARSQTKRSNNSEVDYTEVARVAYELYEERGREDGHDLEDWLRAEAIVRQQSARRN